MLGTIASLSPENRKKQPPVRTEREVTDMTDTFLLPEILDTQSYIDFISRTELCMEVKLKIATYSNIWERIQVGRTFCPATEQEERICQDFQKFCYYPKELELTCENGRAVVRITTSDRYDTKEAAASFLAKKFESYVKVQLKSEFYAVLVRNTMIFIAQMRPVKIRKSCSPVSRVVATLAKKYDVNRDWVWDEAEDRFNVFRGLGNVMTQSEISELEFIIAQEVILDSIPLKGEAQPARQSPKETDSNAAPPARSNAFSLQHPVQTVERSAKTSGSVFHTFLNHQTHAYIYARIRSTPSAPRCRSPKNGR